ncbi:7TM diverse intracellular signaling domain-containing protein [Belliella kenyensis]|uniref:histidine kinase n=1 Tax=Belliella kenyensis TaxID=1472724 RepID=A0ABV8ELY8_9BACT|nr:7TM diverse intracellular signaling domain-containing protein [Belliella kenyensis]MCH7403642.1 sensor histidine kinase [Belliella kenyensis]MDN3602205.1 7TM diverse intracellular signaling domain-containing protein [Belliella kenyensis]
MKSLPTIREPLIIGLVITLFVFLPIYGFLNLNDDQFVYEIDAFEIYENPTFENVIDTVFTPSGVLNLGNQRKVFVGFDISRFNYLSEHSGITVIEIRNPTFREVITYFKNENKELEELDRSGTSLGKTNMFSNPNPLVFLEENSGIDSLFISIESNEPIVFEVSVISEEGFHSMNYKKSMIVNIYIGIMFALFLYNFILFFLIKDITYFFYSIYILFIALAQTSLMGYSYYYFLGMNVKLYELSIIGFSAISGMAGISFMRLFLKTKDYTPVLDKFLKLNIIVYLAAFVFRLFGSLSFSYKLTDVSGLMVIVLFGFSATRIARKGYRPAAYFIIGWLFFFIGLLIFILQSNGIINVTMVANFPMLLGTAMEAILLSLALADKINVLKKEKEDEQMERLRMLKENEKLILVQNESLEAKVRARTEELENTLVNLQNTQTQLVNQEKMASLGQLTAGIAHEINNPINFVSSNISPLKRDIKDLLEVVQCYREYGEDQFSDTTKKELKELEEDIELDYVLQEIDQLLRGMEDGAKRTVEIVKGLRLFSRVDEQDVKKVDIHDGINSTLVLLNSSMSGKIKIVKDYGDIPMVECLAGKINQVFMNIITNAIHALQDHIQSNPDPEIVIATKNHHDYISIEIKDNGPGMPDSVKQRIFEPFFTTKAVGKGTGLGLSIVYTIIENHGGTLEVLTKEGQGTSFIITLPIYQNSIQNE